MKTCARTGERVWIAWTNKVYFDDQGQIERILSIGTDITRRGKRTRSCAGSTPNSSRE